MVTSGDGSVHGISSGQVRSGIAWVAGLSVLSDGLQFVVNLALVRLLDARAYGEFSLISSILAFFAVTSFRGFLEHALQARPAEAVDFQSHFTFAAATQAIAALLLNALAILLWRIPRYAAVAPALALMSLFLLFDSAGELRVKMLERELNWRLLRSLEAAAFLIGVAASIALALAGAGVYALLAPGAVALLPFAWDLLVTRGWRPSWSFDRAGFAPAWRYGWARVASGLAARGQQLIESGTLAAHVGLAALGVYGRAMSLASFACLKLTSIATLTVFPMLTRYPSRSRSFRKAGGLLLRAVAWTSIPAAALLSILAAPLVHLLYGARWLAVIPLLAPAMAIACATALSESFAFVLLSSGQPRKTLAVDVIHLGGTVVCLALLLPRGVAAYMTGLAAVLMVAALCGATWALRDELIEADAVFSALAWPVASAAAALALAHVSPLGAALALVLGYPAGLLVFARRRLREMLEYVPGGAHARRLFH